MEVTLGLWVCVKEGVPLEVPDSLGVSDWEEDWLCDCDPVPLSEGDCDCDWLAVADSLADCDWLALCD